MTNGHDSWTDQISEYLDEEMEGARQRSMAQHLTGCEICRTAVEDLRSLKEAARRLGESQPSRDLWPEIRRRLENPSAKTGARPVNQPPRGWLPLALAASLLVAVSSTLTLWVVAPINEYDWQATGTAWQDPTILAARYAGAVEAEFGPARVALRARTGRDLDQIDSDTKDRILANLREIDTATQEIRSAIGRDPNAIYLVEMLVALYTQEMNILRQANRTTQRLQETPL